jgi:hypothetical protein
MIDIRVDRKIGGRVSCKEKTRDKRERVFVRE